MSFKVSGFKTSTIERGLWYVLGINAILLIFLGIIFLTYSLASGNTVFVLGHPVPAFGLAIPILYFGVRGLTRWVRSAKKVLTR